MWRRVRFCRGGLEIVAAVVVGLAASAGSAVDETGAGRWREKVRVVWDESTNASARRASMPTAASRMASVVVLTLWPRSRLSRVRRRLSSAVTPRIVSCFVMPA